MRSLFAERKQQQQQQPQKKERKRQTNSSDPSARTHSHMLIAQTVHAQMYTQANIQTNSDTGFWQSIQ